jgi:hypothetical protein
MALTDLEPIRRRPDGSIDTEHYVLVAHEERRRQIRAFAEALETHPSTMFGKWARARARWLFHALTTALAPRRNVA